MPRFFLEKSNFLLYVVTGDNSEQSRARKGAVQSAVTAFQSGGPEKLSTLDRTLAGAALYRPSHTSG